MRGECQDGLVILLRLRIHFHLFVGAADVDDGVGIVRVNRKRLLVGGDAVLKSSRLIEGFS